MSVAAPATSGAERTSERRSAGVFPGDRRVWLAAALAGMVLLCVAAVELLRPREVYTGTNSVTTRSVVAEVADDQHLCVPGLEIPAGTGRIELMYVGAGERPALAGRLLSPSGDVASTGVPAGPAGPQKAVFPIARRADSPATSRATFCVSTRGAPAAIGGMLGLQGDSIAPRLDGRRVEARVGVWYRPPAGERTTLLEQLPTIARRAALFRPGWVGAWTYWVLLLVVAPALAYAALRTLASSAARRPQRLGLALTVGLIALANGAIFATLTPAFHAPDEIDHAAYVQVLGETGKRPTLVPGRGAYSEEQNLALEAVRAHSSIEQADGRPPWLAVAEERWRARVRDAMPLGRDEGGGPTTPGTHRPGYYLLAAPPYLAARSDGWFSALWAMRLVSALLAAIVAAACTACVRELLPTAPSLAAAAAGLLVAFLPQFNFMSGAVNNDMGVNAIAAVALWLGARALRRTPEMRVALALGLAAALLPLFKATGIALYPALVVAVLGGVVRHRSPRSMQWLGALAAGLLIGRGAILLVDTLITEVRAPAAPPGGAGVATGAGDVLSSVINDPRLYLSYLWQTFLPPLYFMRDLFVAPSYPFFEIYVRQGFASFGWYAMEFADWVYQVVFAAGVVITGAAAVRVWQRRRRLPACWPEVAFVVLAVVGVVAGVAGAYMTSTPRVGALPEQGRYAFTALAALAVVPALALLALSERRRPWAAGAVVAGMIAVQWASQVMLLQRFYT